MGIIFIEFNRVLIYRNAVVNQSNNNIKIRPFAREFIIEAIKSNKITIIHSMNHINAAKCIKLFLRTTGISVKDIEIKNKNNFKAQNSGLYIGLDESAALEGMKFIAIPPYTGEKNDNAFYGLFKNLPI